MNGSLGLLKVKVVSLQIIDQAKLIEQVALK